jgi:hypothetical protein
MPDGTRAIARGRQGDVFGEAAGARAERDAWDDAGDEVAHADGVDAVADGGLCADEVAAEDYWEFVRQHVPHVACGD